MVGKNGNQFMLDQVSRTKTVATVGPACNSIEGLAELIRRGVDVFRINMAHGQRPDHEQVVQNIRQANQRVGRATALLIDLAGPKIRLGELLQDPMTVNVGDHVFFVRNDPQTPFELTATYDALIDEVQPGHEIVLADGIIRMRAVAKQADRIECVVEDGGTFRSRQGINLPATHLSVPALGPVDRENAIWAAGQQVDFVSLSFVRNADEIMQLKRLLAEQQSTAQVIAKIEKREALDNLESIIEAADGIMVARGDLGVEIEIWKTPIVQKRIIRLCTQHRKPVIVATQMLESMHTSKQPTRAEVTDVANAILDGCDACMLSGETAIGQFPNESVTMMQRIMLATEEMFRGRSSRGSSVDGTMGEEIAEAVMYGSANIARRLGAKIVVVASSTGESALMKSKQHDYIPTVCVTNRPEIQRRMCLYWGVIPVLCDDVLSPEQLRDFVDQWARECAGASTGDVIVVVADNQWLPGVHDNIMVAVLP